MFKPQPRSLALYKGRPALVSETGEKITIMTAAASGKTETFKVREKDIEVLHPGPLNTLAGLAGNADSLTGDVSGAWELIESGGEPVSLKELAELAFGAFTPENAWAARLLLADGLYFSGSAEALTARSAAEVAAVCEKKRDKEQEAREREEFLVRFRDGSLHPGDGRFLQDIEALAYGKSEKSRTMKELGRPETPQDAHRILLESGFWDVWINPHPRRFGISLNPASALILEQDERDEERADLSYLPAFAIDSPWSDDPDDAVSLENSPEGPVLYVHVADPASVVLPGSPADLEAGNRGATAYLPEQCVRMLCEQALPLFALGLSEKSRALSFKIILGKDGTPALAGIIPSIVKVSRLTYEEADRALASDSAVLRGLSVIARANLERRLNAGAVHIELPEIHLTVRPPGITVESVKPFISAEIIRECMLITGEAAAVWAAERKLAFPRVTQEPGDLPAKPLPGFAGSYQFRRCMRPRAVSVQPGRHWGLGLDAYTQVTSPLRRYADLLAHQQIRAFLAEGSGARPLDADEVLARLAAGDAAAQAVSHAERASKAHWMAVYLSGKKDVIWNAVVLEKRGPALGVIIPELALETQIHAPKNLEPNDPVKLKLVHVRIPEAETVFMHL